MNKPFAAFDIDGTIIRWQLYHAVAQELARTGHIDPKRFEDVRQSRMNWKRRLHQASYKDYERKLVELYDEAIQDVPYDIFMQAAETVFDEYKDQTYTYTRDLIRSLKKQGYMLFAISASQAEVVKLLADYYGFDDCGGSIYTVKDGRFTGEKDVLKRDRKPEFLKELAYQHEVTFDGSIAVGDSDSDIPMLSMVEQPIAFNPDKQLFQHAQENRWKIVIERKNMVYELGQHDGSYLLEETN